MDLAQRTVQALDASGARVALVSRAGQDLLRGIFGTLFGGGKGR